MYLSIGKKGYVVVVVVVVYVFKHCYFGLVAVDVYSILFFLARASNLNAYHNIRQKVSYGYS